MNKFLALDVTEQVIAREHANHFGVRMSDFLAELNSESKVLTFALFNRQIFQLQIKEWMYSYDDYAEMQKAVRRFELHNLESEKFTKLHYSHLDQTIYLVGIEL